MGCFDMQLGFSTGAVALGEFRQGLDRLKPFHLPAVELSALRVHELTPLLQAMDSLDLNGYSYVGMHAPGRFTPQQEPAIVDGIRQSSYRFAAIIVHPDALHDLQLWSTLGNRICFENMDKRKKVGRTADELSTWFSRFPEASLCVDLGHAWQVDRTMTEARQILIRFQDRIRQIHVSEVNTQSQHIPLSFSTVTAFRKVLDLIPEVPWILEAVIPPERIEDEIRYVRESFQNISELIAD
jgi:hypothetical protein